MNNIAKIFGIGGALYLLLSKTILNKKSGNAAQNKGGGENSKVEAKINDKDFVDDLYFLRKALTADELVKYTSKASGSINIDAVYEKLMKGEKLSKEEREYKEDLEMRIGSGTLTKEEETALEKVYEKASKSADGLKDKQKAVNAHIKYIATLYKFKKANTEGQDVSKYIKDLNEYYKENQSYKDELEGKAAKENDNKKVPVKSK